MTQAIGRAAPAMVALCMTLAACSSPSDPAPGNDAAAPGNAAAAAGNASGHAVEQVDANAEAPTKSILRPDVVQPAPEPSPVQPIDAVIAFDAAGAALPDASRTMLDELIATPAFAAGGAVTLRGHSDTRGNDRANLIASRKRAELVRDYLLEKGVDPDRITVVALGETTPLVPNAHPDGSDDPEARARNRRVEIHVDLPGPPPPEESAGNSATPAP